MVNPMCESASDKSDKTARKWLRLEIPPCRGTRPSKKGMSGGIEIISKMKRVNIHGDSGDISHPTTNVRNIAGAESVRRRLSIIFHRLIAEIVYWRPCSGGKPPFSYIKGITCHSPPPP